MKNDLLKSALILCAITTAAALLLGTLYETTSKTIQQRADSETQQALKQALSSAKSFEKVEITQTKTVSELYKADNGGYCVKVAPSGFSGEISTIVGIDSEGKVAGVIILSMSETPGLGTKVNDKNYLSQYSGKQNGLKLIKSKQANENEVSAISGATVSSRALWSGVNDALNFVVDYKTKNGDINTQNTQTDAQASTVLD